ncbi:MAG: hypothetical protein IJR58_00235 [Lachnospiraceae bacterium]|nr:hypothetical protein [Lachnospiraceae bacterium]
MRLFSDAQKSYVLGYDLGDEVSQISFLAPDADMPETLSVLAGAEQYNIPTVLYKRKGVGQWFYGKEAAKRTDGEDGTRMEHLLSAARTGKPIIIDGSEYDPVSLLTLFVKRTLSLLTMEMSIDHVEAIVFTAENLDKRMVEVLSEVTGALNLKTKRIFYQSYEESLYYYMLYQPPELKFKHVLACDYKYGALSVYDLMNNYHTTPIVTSVKKAVYDVMRLPGGKLPRDAVELNRIKKQLDAEFLKVLRRIYEDREVTSVYLLGDGYKGDWAQESLSYLCNTSRVFQGNNLFSKGATIAARERISESEAGTKQILLGDDKLKSNLGIRLKKQGVESYQALMDAGVNWFEVGSSIDIILSEGNEIQIEKTPLTGSEPSVTTIVLEGLARRPKGTTRLRLLLDMTDEKTVRVQVKDLGFGDIFKSTGMHWEETFTV